MSDEQTGAALAPDIAAEQEAVAKATPSGIAVESTTRAGGEQPRSSVTIARGPHDNVEAGILEGDAMIVAAHRLDDGMHVRADGTHPLLDDMRWVAEPTAPVGVMASEAVP